MSLRWLWGKALWLLQVPATHCQVSSHAVSAWGRRAKMRLDSSGAVVSPSVCSHLHHDRLLSLCKCRSLGLSETFSTRPAADKAQE